MPPLLSQTGFAVALGVLLAAFVMAWVLVPSLTALLGRKAFWPGKTSRTRTEPRTRRRQTGQRPTSSRQSSGPRLRWPKA